MITPDNARLKYSDFVRYEQHDDDSIFYNMLMGLELKKGFIHEYISMNVFAEESTKIPKGYKKVPTKLKYMKKLFLNKTRKLLDGKHYKAVKTLNKGAKTYQIMDNGGISFVVYVNPGKKSEKVVRVYAVSDKHYSIHNDNIFERYISLVIEFTPKRIFIGKSPKNAMTTFSGGYGPEFDGNTILLHIKAETYVLIGSTIEQITICTGDTITSYKSPVGNSGVPYPFIIGKKYIYVNDSYVDRKAFLLQAKKDKNDSDVWDYYFNHLKHNLTFEKQPTQLVLVNRQ